MHGIAGSDCMHIAATEVIVGQIDSIHGILPAVAFRGKNYSTTYSIIAKLQFVSSLYLTDCNQTQK